MNIITASYTDVRGGADRAAYRIHHALRSNGLNSTMRVVYGDAGDWTVQDSGGILTHNMYFCRLKLVNELQKYLTTNNQVLHSSSILPSNWSGYFNRSQADLIHLHWINHEMMSIRDIGCIDKPVVWTLHDMWAFCGAEHYSEDVRWQEGYRKGNRPQSESGFDVNRWTWERKKKHWKRPMQLVAPSRWMEQCVRDSSLMGAWPVVQIANPVDTDFWRPVDKCLAKDILGLDPETPVLLFGALGGKREPRKGFDLLQKALEHLCGEKLALQLLICGQRDPEKETDTGFPVHYTGHLHDDLSLKMVYNAADVLVIPSRQDNLPNTGVEAQACGTPMVAFNVGGLSDIVQHEETGYLVQPFDTMALAERISAIVSDREKHQSMSKAARDSAVKRFSCSVIAKKYMNVYENNLNGQMVNG